MIRYLGSVGLAGGFLVFSPNIRESVGDLGVNVRTYLVAHSPYSWAAVAGGTLLAMWFLARASACNNHRV